MVNKPTLVGLAAAGILAGAAALAQTADPGTVLVPAAAERTAPASKAPATLPTTIATSAPSKPLSAQDRKFVETAAEAGVAEVEMARVAMEHASSTDVKSFASRMVSDHEQAGSDLDKIAASKGETVNEGVSAKHQAQLDRLGKLQGESFDREYLKSQLAEHKAAAALFDKQAKRGGESELKQFAASTLPTLQDHLQLVQQLAKSPPRASTAPGTFARTKKS